MVNMCLVCGAASGGTHYGVQACNACSFFFRRTVLLNRKYRCHSIQRCKIDMIKYKKCRSCRFQKCLQLGMSWKGFSDNIQRTPQSITSENPSNINDELIKTLKTHTIFDELLQGYSRLKYHRDIFYKNDCCSDKIAHIEIQSFRDKLFQQHGIESKLYLSLITSNSAFALFDDVEKHKIFYSAARHMHAVEILYASWNCQKVQNAHCFAMPNGIFANVEHVDHYLKHDETVSNDPNLYTIYKIHVLAFANTMEIIDTFITDVQPTEEDLVFLIGLFIFDPTIPNISKTTREALQLSRNLLIKEFMENSEDAMIDGVLQLDKICSVVAAIKIYVQKLAKNLTMLRYFDVIPHDLLFDQIWDVQFN